MRQTKFCIICGYCQTTKEKSKRKFCSYCKGFLFAANSRVGKIGPRKTINECAILILKEGDEE